VALIEETLVEQVGVESAAVDLASTRAVVTFDPTVIAVEQLQAAITEVGYTATPAG
jgi:copper chaperone CopZ